MKRRGIMAAFAVIIVMFAIIGVYVYASYSRIKPDKDKICNGIKVDSIDISGMTEEEASVAVNSYITQLGSRNLVLDINGETVTSRLDEAGYSFSAGDFLNEAMKIGKSGNMIENYRQIKAAAQGKYTYKVTMALDEEVLKKYIKKNSKKMCVGAKNAEIKMEDGKLVYTKAKDGISIDTERTMQLVKEAVEASGGTEVQIPVTAEIKVQQPEITEETAARCKDKIGTFTTSFNAGNVNRTKNLANAARLISGTVLYPGDTFSVHDTISPLTEENGYYEAASYNNGKVEDSLGGGVCQVSTTLYNAVLRAELEITERSPHSMVVSYVKPSMDAAIAGDYKDFKFKNNTSVPIYIQGGTYGSSIYFTLYGEETRSPDRTIRFESEVTDTIQPGADKVTFDKTKPESYMTVTQEAHIGYKAKLWKIVKENGKETKTQINSSTYSASPRYVTRGAKKEPKPTPKPTKKPSSRDREDNSREEKSGRSTRRSAGGTTGGSTSDNAGADNAGNSGGMAVPDQQPADTPQDAAAGIPSQMDPQQGVQ